MYGQDEFSNAAFDAVAAVVSADDDDKTESDQSVAGSAEPEESEASFTSGDEGSSGTDDDDVPPCDDDSDSDGQEGRARKPVKTRLARIKSSYSVDAQRTLAWLEERVGAAGAALDDELAHLASMSQPAALQCTMHGYQLDGMRWLVALHRAGLSGILADEMGLGKTLQAIALLAHLSERGAAGPFLVIAPLSTLSGWDEQLRGFCPSLRVIRYSGDAAARASIRERQLSAAAPAGGGVVVLASYEPVLADAPALLGVRWGYLVVDEAHRLKSRGSALYVSRSRLTYYLGEVYL